MKRKVLLFFLFVLLAAASGFLTYKVIIVNKRVAVPSLKGKPPVAAVDELRDMGLKLKVKGRDFDPVVQPGFIMSQEPAAGENARLGGAVEVVLSMGPATARMPSVLGRNSADAASFLERSGLEVLKTIPVYSINSPAGTVMAQDPNPGEKSGPVSLIVSKGPSEVSYYCPDFTGMSSAQAQTLIAALGLQPVLEGNPGGFLPGGANLAVYSQKPALGTKIAAGQQITLFLGPASAGGQPGGAQTK